MSLIVVIVNAYVLMCINPLGMLWRYLAIRAGSTMEVLCFADHDTYIAIQKLG